LFPAADSEFGAAVSRSVNLAELVRDRAARQGGALAVVQLKPVRRTLSWAQLTSRALLGGLVESVGAQDPGRVIGLALPLSGGYGLVAVIGSWLLRSGALVLLGERSDLGAAVRTESITHLPVTPPLLIRLLRSPGLSEPPESLRTAVSAGATLPQTIAEEFRRRTGRRVDRPRYKRPDDVRLVTRLPHTPAGTIRRAALRELVESSEAADVAALGEGGGKG